MNVFGDNLNNALIGTNGADMFFGFEGNDAIWGQGGNDMIKGGGGADFIDGGAGTDTVNYTDSAEGVLVDLWVGQGLNGTAEGDTYLNVESVVGSFYGDVLIGNAGNNVLNGYAGADMLAGGGGSDGLLGGDGNDWLQGGAGADYLVGGDGIDTADYSTSAGRVVVHLNDGITAWNDAAGDELDGIENLIGSASHDDLWGDAGANMLQGNGGNDDLRGFEGNDTLFGGTGNDVLSGGAGTDILYGGDNVDTLDGGEGVDHMVGGAWHDTYVVDETLDEVVELAGEGWDTVQSSTHFALPDNVEALTLTGTGDMWGTGNALNNTVTGNTGDNGLNGGAGADTLTGGGGDDQFWFAPGQANGDVVVDFVGNGAGAGDMLYFSGFGAGATFTQVDATHWQITSNGGLNVDVITFTNAASIHATDFMFV